MPTRKRRYRVSWTASGRYRFEPVSYVGSSSLWLALSLIITVLTTIIAIVFVIGALISKTNQWDFLLEVFSVLIALMSSMVGGLKFFVDKRYG